MKLDEKLSAIANFKSSKCSGVLTSFCDRDFPELSQLYGDSETMKYLGGPLTSPQVETTLKLYIQQSQRFPFGPNAIRDIEQKQLIGRTGLRVSTSEQVIEVFPASGSNATICLPLKKIIQLGYVVSPSFRYQGIATASAIAVLDFGFRCLQVNEICAFMQAENYASVKVARDKLNMTLLGNFLFNDKLWFYYYLTREAYLNR